MRRDFNSNCYTYDQAEHVNDRAPTGYASYEFHPIVSRLSGTRVKYH